MSRPAAEGMKTAGMSGGIGPESTIEYYRGIVAEYRRAKGEDIYPSIAVNSVNLPRAAVRTRAGRGDRRTLASEFSMQFPRSFPQPFLA
jgi:aspartate/glutamate racemase